MPKFIKRKPIDSFTGEYFFLSNFYLIPILYEGMEFPSTEHAYQAAKTLDLELRKEFQSGRPGQAKRKGREVALRPDWEAVKLDVMYELLCIKFSNPELAHKLLSTGSVELIEGNWWKDRFWGVHEGVGLNHLGKLLMKVRSLL